MGAQTLYKPQDVNHLHVENATSGRRRGADTRGGRIHSSEPWLEYADNSPSAIMADWPSWEPTNTSPMQQSSSPMLHSSSSQSSYDALQLPRTQDVPTSTMQPPAGSTTPPRSSLIETLQTVLRSNSSPSPPASRSSPQLGTPARPLKRRSRVSRRVPPIELEASSTDFLDIVQRLTGVSASAQSSAQAAAPVRPLPQRARPLTTFFRPDRPSSTLNFPGNNSQVVSSHQKFSLSQMLAPRRFDGGSSSSTFATPSPIVATAPSSWWDSGPSDLIPPTVDHLSTSTPSGAGSSTVLPEGSELSLTQFDAWLSGDQDDIM